MSWTPTFWMFRKDFDKIRKELFEIDTMKAWEFQIGIHEGVVIAGNDTTHSSEEIHEVIKNLHHWILSGENDCCPKGYGWGDEISKTSNPSNQINRSHPI